MTQVHIAKALGDQVIPPLELTTKGTIEVAPMTTGAINAVFQADAKLVVDALFASLPGGTLDQILIQFLQRKASSYIVKF